MKNVLVFSTIIMMWFHNMPESLADTAVPRRDANGLSLQSYSDPDYDSSWRLLVDEAFRETRLEVATEQRVNEQILKAANQTAQLDKFSQHAMDLSLVGLSLVDGVKKISIRNSWTTERVLNTVPPFQLYPFNRQAQPDKEMPRLPSSGGSTVCPYPERISCGANQHLTYRTFDGSCNNLNQPLTGRALTPFSRILPPKYADGLESMRTSVSGVALPGARQVSTKLFTDINKPHPIVTIALVYFGQFLDHDLTSTPIHRIPSKTSADEVFNMQCGSTDCSTGEGLRACLPIPVLKNDPDFFNTTCINFLRSMAVPNLRCALGPREQLNLNTHWLDGSQVYGSSKRDADNLRDFSLNGRGKMRINSPNDKNQKPLPPNLPPNEANVSCENRAQTFSCFTAGDARVNENIGLGMYHTLFLRFHNEVEQMLFNLNNRGWTGEQLFQEARKIVGAVLQHITYNEFLPLVLGPATVQKHGLELLKTGYYSGYDSGIDARIPNSFAAAAYRFGHSLIQERIFRTVAGVTNNSLFLSETFNNPSVVHSTGGVDSFIQGMAAHPSQSFDFFFTKQMTRSLFTDSPPNGPGLDLGSLNIQRGRDHGLPPYNDFRQECGLARATSFEGLSREVTDASFRTKLSATYSRVDDIDLFVGGLAEAPMAGGIVGPTFGCIIAKTFRNLRKGDDFWYENANGGFKPEQLTEIRKVTMASVFCLTGDAVTQIQPSVFAQDKTNTNRVVSCNFLPKINLQSWKTTL